MIRTMVHSLKNQSDADKYSDDMNELLRNGWEFIDEQKEYYDSAWNIISQYEKAVVEELPEITSPTEESAPEPPNDTGFIEVDIYKHHKENPSKTTFYPEPNINYKFIASGTLRDTLKINLYGGGKGVLQFSDISILINNDKMAFAFNDMAINKGKLPTFTGRVELDGLVLEGNSLRDAINMTCGDADVVITNTIVDNCGSAGDGSHPDVLQMSRGFKSLTIDTLTATNIHYQGLFFGNDRNGKDKNSPVGKIVLKDVYLSGKSDKPLIQFYHHSDSGAVELKNVSVDRVYHDVAKQVEFKILREDGGSSNARVTNVDGNLTWDIPDSHPKVIGSIKWVQNA